MLNIAENFDDFVAKVSEGIRKTLNTETGQDITEQLLKMKLAENPNLTPEEWKDVNSHFMTYLFCMFVQENSNAMHELAGHVYDELNKGAEI